MTLDPSDVSVDRVEPYSVEILPGCVERTSETVEVSVTGSVTGEDIGWRVEAVTPCPIDVSADCVGAFSDALLADVKYWVVTGSELVEISVIDAIAVEYVD